MTIPIVVKTVVKPRKNIRKKLGFSNKTKLF